MGDVNLLLDAYEHTLRSILDVTDGLGADRWATPTRCPGWDVHDQLAHVVGLESYLAGDELPPEAPPADFIRGPVGSFMQRAVHARRGQTPDQLRADLAAVILRRQAQLRGRGPHDEMPGLLGRPMPLRRLLPLRVYDVWAHEQDIRAAVERPGGLTGPAADVSWTQLVYGLVDALAQADPGPDASIRVAVTGARPDAMSARTAADGSAQAGDVPAQKATATVTLEWSDLVARMCGRAGATGTAVRIDGDHDLAERVLAGLAMTP